MRVKQKSYSALLQITDDLPGLDVSLTEENTQPGQFELRVSAKEHEPVSYRLSVLWAGSGWPSEVLRTTRGVEKPWPRDLVVAARSFSPGALELLRELDANWLDEQGNVRLIMPPALLISKEARGGGKVKNVGFSWSPSSTSIAELILSGGMEQISLHDIAGKTGWSVPQASNVLRAFDREGWTERHGPPRGRGVWREITNPGALLDALAAHLKDNRPTRRLGHRLMREPLRFLSEELAPALSKIGDWGVTGWAGLEIVAPYTSVVPSLQVYVPFEELHRGITGVFDEAMIREVQDGGNIEFWAIDTPLIATDHGGSAVPVINLPRLFSDLLALGGRAEDGAKHLREVEIGY